MRGGAREGAGRKPKGIKYVSDIAHAEGKIRDRLPWLVDQMLELAQGVTVTDGVDDDGEQRVFVRPPDRQAIAYLMDRVMGKPIDRREEGPAGSFTGLDEIPEDAARQVIEAGERFGSSRRASQ